MPVGVPGTGYWSNTGWVEGGNASTDKDYLRVFGGAANIPSLSNTPKATSEPFYGAAGRGEFLGSMSEEEMSRMFPITEPTSMTQNPGESLSDFQNRIRNSPFNLAGGGNYSSSWAGGVPTLSNAQSSALGKQYGLEGLKYDFTGMTQSQANQKAEELKKKYMGETSALTSYTFNPETITGVKNSMSRLMTGLNDIGDSFNADGTKQDKTKSLLEVSAGDIAKSFMSVEELQQALMNPDVQKELQPFIKAGGSLNDVAMKVVQGQQPVNTAPQGSQDYISSLNENNRMYNDPVAAKRAEQELFTEGQIAQDRIAQIAKIPNDLMKFYFGDEKTIGLYQMQVKQAEETIKNLENKIITEQANARTQASFEVEKVNAQVSKARAQTEENRLTAKNYMTGMLAKLGALKTTGEAPSALANLEAKYQRQINDLETQADFTVREINMNMANKLATIESTANDKIFSIKNDLSKESTDMFKEVMKAQQAAEKEAYGIVASHATKLRTQTEKFEKEAKKLAEDNIKDFYTVVNGAVGKATMNDIMSGQAFKKVNTLEAMNDNQVTSVVNTILQGVPLPQLYSRFPQFSQKAIKELWEQMTSKNEGEPKYTQLSDGKWRITYKNGSSELVDYDPRGMQNYQTSGGSNAAPVISSSPEEENARKELGF